MNSRFSSELAELVPLPDSGWSCTRYSNRLHDFCVTIRRSYKDVNNFLPHPAKIWNSFSIERFPLTNDLNGFKIRISRTLLFVSSIVCRYVLFFICLNSFLVFFSSFSSFCCNFMSCSGCSALHGMSPKKHFTKDCIGNVRNFIAENSFRNKCCRISCN